MFIAAPCENGAVFILKQNKIMGFSRGGNVTKGRVTHRWLNSPNKSHRICTICGMRMDRITVDRKSVYIYTDKSGIRYDSCPECKR